MNYAPLAGRCVVRKIATEETLPGGRIILTKAVQEAMILQQAELVAVGPDEIYDDPDDAAESHWPELSQLQQGAWLLMKSRSWIETDMPDLWIVRHGDIIATIQEN